MYTYRTLTKQLSTGASSLSVVNRLTIEPTLRNGSALWVSASVLTATFVRRPFSEANKSVLYTYFLLPPSQMFFKENAVCSCLSCCVLRSRY